MRASTASLLVPGLKKRSIFSRGMRNCSTWLGLRSPMMDAMASRDSAPCSESLRILDAVASDLPPGTPVSLMRQYTPMNGVSLPGLDRRLTVREYARVRDHMLALGLEGYLQSRESADAAFTPDFTDEESVRLFPAKN